MEKRGQIWVETVVYTLIGLAIIGIVMGIATPRIRQMTDKATIEQTITAMNELNEKIFATQVAMGNTRLASFKIKKGKFIIDGAENSLRFVLEETSLKYSQPGSAVKQGDITILTEEIGDKRYNVNLILEYGLDIRYDGSNQAQTLTQAPTAYQLVIENKGEGVLDIRPA